MIIKNSNYENFVSIITIEMRTLTCCTNDPHNKDINATIYIYSNY